MRQNDAERWVNSQIPNVVWMGLKGCDLFVCVAIEDTQLEVVGAGHEPVLAGNEADAADRDLSDLERLDQRASIVVVDINSAIVETGKDPGLSGMEVDALNAI